MNTIIITGAASGIGFELANQLNKKYKIIIIDKKKPKKKVENSIYIKFDFNKIILIPKLIKKIIPNIKNNLILINNVAYRNKKNKDTLDHWIKSINVNLISTFFLTEKIIKKYSKKITIININSVLSSKINIKESCAYHCTKASLKKLSDYLSVKYTNSKVNIFSISLGLFKKNQNKKILTITKKVKKYYPNKRIADSSNLADLINYLSSNNNNFLNGLDFRADGGYLKNDPVSVSLM
jgi:NAD(P)-dependent dehydrogenase (short-subunit alcohol dehydrogenase family)